MWFLKSTVLFMCLQLHWESCWPVAVQQPDTATRRSCRESTYTAAPLICATAPPAGEPPHWCLCSHWRLLCCFKVGYCRRNNFELNGRITAAKLGFKAWRREPWKYNYIISVNTDPGVIVCVDTSQNLNTSGHWAMKIMLNFSRLFYFFAILTTLLTSGLNVNFSGRTVWRQFSSRSHRFCSSH